jgi:hypothetical protein
MLEALVVSCYLYSCVDVKLVSLLLSAFMIANSSFLCVRLCVFRVLTTCEKNISGSVFCELSIFCNTIDSFAPEDASVSMISEWSCLGSKRLIGFFFISKSRMPYLSLGPIPRVVLNVFSHYCNYFPLWYHIVILQF